MIAIFTDSFPTRAFRRATELLARSLPVHNFSYDGEHLYLSQWYKHRLLKLDSSYGLADTDQHK